MHPGLRSNSALDPLHISSHSGHQLRPVQTAGRRRGAGPHSRNGQYALGHWRFKCWPLCETALEADDPVGHTWRILEAIIVAVSRAVVDDMECT